MRGFLCLLAPAVVLAVVAASCGFKPEPTGAQPPFPLQVVDGAGRTVSEPASPRRIVSLDPGVTEWLFAIGAGGRMAGRAGGELYPRAAHRLPALAPGGVPDVPRVAALQPDLVIAPRGTSAAAAGVLARRARAPVYVPGPATVLGIEHDTLAVAALVGAADRGGRLAAGLRSAVDRVRRKTAGTPRVPVFVDRGAFFTIDPHGFGALLLGLAGGRNVAAQAPAAAPFPLARLRAAAPRVYLALPGATTLAALRRSPATRGLPAVRSGDFHLISRGDLTDTGPRMGRTLARLATLLAGGSGAP